VAVWGQATLIERFHGTPDDGLGALIAESEAGGLRFVRRPAGNLSFVKPSAAAPAMMRPL
jgi:hypothetical protein